MAFTKGISGNPGGRVKDKPFRDALRLTIADAKSNPRKLRRIAEKLFDKAVEGDVQAIKEIADRLDGKPVQQVAGDIESGPITIKWETDD